MEAFFSGQQTQQAPPPPTEEAIRREAARGRAILQEYKKVRSPFTLAQLPARFDAALNTEHVWFEAVCCAEEGSMTEAGDLFGVALLAYWDFRNVLHFSGIYPKERMEQFVASGKASPEAQAAHTLMASERNTHSVWKRLEKIAEAHPECGSVLIMCGRAAQDSSLIFQLGKPVVSPFLCFVLALFFPHRFNIGRLSISCGVLRRDLS